MIQLCDFCIKCVRFCRWVIFHMSFWHSSVFFRLTDYILIAFKYICDLSLKEFVILTRFLYQVWCFLAWFPISCTFCPSETNIHTASTKITCFGIPYASVNGTYPFSTFCDMIWMDFFNNFWVSFYHLYILYNYQILFSILKFLTPIHLFVTLRGYFDLGSHKSTFYSRFITLETSNIVVVCFVNKVFLLWARPVLNNASKRLIINLS